LSRSPSTSARISTLTRSSWALSRRCRASWLAYSYICIETICASSREFWNSVSSKPMSLLLHSKIWRRSICGLLTMSRITCVGIPGDRPVPRAVSLGLPVDRGLPPQQCKHVVGDAADIDVGVVELDILEPGDGSGALRNRHLVSSHLVRLAVRRRARRRPPSR